MNVSLHASILCVFALLPSTFSPAQDSEHETSPPSSRILEIDDAFKIKNTGRPDLSPDGKLVAYTVTTRNFETNSSKTRIWMKATKERRAHPHDG